MEKICGIYLIQNKVNNKKYVGASRHIYARWNRHRYMLIKNTHNEKIQNDYNKYGKDNFEFFIIEKVNENISRRQLKDLEDSYIEKYDSINNGYNMITNSYIPNEIRYKVSIKRKEYYNGINGNQHRKRVSESLKGNIPWNYTPIEVQNKIKQMLLEKKSIAEITKECGLKRSAICNYKHELLEQGLLEPANRISKDTELKIKSMLLQQIKGKEILKECQVNKGTLLTIKKNMIKEGLLKENDKPYRLIDGQENTVKEFLKMNETIDFIKEVTGISRTVIYKVKKFYNL